MKVLDPIWSGAYITRNHGYMLYDVLFAMDEKFQVGDDVLAYPGDPSGSPEEVINCRCAISHIVQED